MDIPFDSNLWGGALSAGLPLKNKAMWGRLQKAKNTKATEMVLDFEDTTDVSVKPIVAGSDLLVVAALNASWADVAEEARVMPLPVASPAASMLEEVKALIQLPEKIRPTRNALLQAALTITVAALSMRGTFPYGDVMEDESGGIRIEWGNGNKYITLALRADQSGRHYIFYQQGANRGLANVSGQALVQLLQWLTGNGE
jgi:hypothetical protein